jgi:DNA (cytosine-5)-methyltransferase 1
VIAVDLFAGLGGWSTAARSLGIRVAWAANHWPAAVAQHARNHPDTVHACQDLHQTDWRTVPRHDLLLASPACQGHSKARGAEKPHHDALRSTAWAVVSAAEHHRPELVLVENVPEMRDWILYPAWRLAMSALGYGVTEVIADAADHGVPQNRERLFVVCRRGITAPRVTMKPQPQIAASTFVDFTRGAWSPIEKPGRAAATLARIENGRREHGDRFLLPYYGAARGGRCLSRPIGTLSTHDRYALVDGDRMRMLDRWEARDACSFPASTVLPDNHKDAIKMLGNAVPPMLGAAVIRAALAAA